MMRLTEWPHTYINLGIGLAIARRLRREGHGVFICGRDAARLEAALKKI